MKQNLLASYVEEAAIFFNLSVPAGLRLLPRSINMVAAACFLPSQTRATTSVVLSKAVECLLTPVSIIYYVMTPGLGSGALV